MAVYDSVSLDISSQEIWPRGIKFNPTGTRLYLIGAGSDTVYQYNLSVAWNLATASYSGNSFSVNAQDQSPSGIAFNSSGTKLYMLGYGFSNAIHQYTLATAWDISTTSYDSITFASGLDSYELVFNSDGTKLFTLGVGGYIYQYALSTAWDLTTVSFVKDYDLLLLSIWPRGMDFSSDGTKLFILDHTTSEIYQYTLATAWDIGTITYNGKVYNLSTQDITPYGVAFNSTGLKLYILGATTDTLYQYSLGAAWDITTLLRGIKITGFKKNFPTLLSYNGNAVSLTPSDDSNTLATKLQALYAADAVIGGDVGALSVTTPASAILEYTFEVTLSLLDTAAIPSSVEAQDGTSVFTEDSLTNALVALGSVEGISSGRSRLIAWDIDDLIYNSDSGNLVDFIPSAQTGANQVSVASLKGKIVKCEGFAGGFVIYGTGNIVVATFIKSATSMYSFKPVEESEGLVDFRHLSIGKDIHYYWSSKGLVQLDPKAQKMEFITPELTDWIKKHRYPITIQLLSNRFLVIYLQDRNITFSNRSIRNGGVEVTAGKANVALSPVEFNYVSPGASLYPTYARVLLFDTQLGKWGSCDIDCKLLISLTPYNQSGYQLSKNYELMSAQLDNEQRELAVRLADGFTYIANTFPLDSYIAFGHYATHRDKITKLIAVDTEYVDYPDATVEIEKSIDGAKVDFTSLVSYSQTTLAPVQGFNLAAKWFNILIRGHYHLKRMLVKGYTYGRR